MAKKTNFEVNGQKYYRVTRTIGKKQDGTAIRKTFYGSGINEANQKADEYMNNLKNGLVTNYNEVELSKLMNSWMFDFLHNSSKIKPSTFSRYEGIYRNYIKPSDIAGTKLQNCTSIRIQQYINELSQNHTYSQIKYVRDVLRTFFNWCIDCGYLLRNPCKNVELKGNKTDIINKKMFKTVEILTENEINIILNNIEDPSFRLLILLDLATGLREGELLALDWSNIDLKKKTLTVDRSVKEVYVYENENTRHIETKFQAPKTKTSFRTIPIPEALVSILKQFRRKNGLVFQDSKNNPLKQKYVAYRWNKLLKDCNIPHKKFHSIRHTYASTLLKNGVDIQTVAELMGHSAIAITQIYLHSSEIQKQDAVNNLNYLFST